MTADHKDPYEAIAIAVDLADSYGNIDGSHRKEWVIDQMVRALLAEKDYREFREEREKDGYGWSEGIAP